MQRFIFTDDLEGKNSPGTKTIELLHVLEVKGLNGMPSTINGSKAYGKDGITVSSVTMDARPFSILFDILGENFEAAATERRALTSFFGNKKPKRFEYSRDDFKVYLKDVYPAGVYETGVNEKRILNGTMQFIATNPYLKRDIPFSSFAFETAVLEYFEDGIEFPDTGLEYSTAETSITVANNGDEISPALIRFHGPANNPEVINTTTNQKMKVLIEIDSNEYLEVSSETGRVDKIDSENVRHNAFDSISDDSEFINLAVGENIFNFNSAGGGTGYLEVGGVEYYAGI